MQEKVRLLLVDDDRVDQMTFERFVQQKGLPYDYEVAGSAAQARETLAAEQFDIVVMDYFLGDGTALDLFDDAGDTPIIVVTGSGGEEIAVRAMKAGAYDYLVKDPAGGHLTTLPVTVENALRRKRTEEELEQYRQHLEELVEERTSELAGANEQLQIQVAERERAEKRVQRLLDQQIAVNQLALALGESRDLERIYHIIHEHVQSLMDAGSFIISFYDPQQGLIEAGYAVIEGESFDVTQLPPIPLEPEGQGTQSQVIHTGRPLYLPDFREAVPESQREYIIQPDGSVVEGHPSEAERETSTNSALLAPMKVEGAIVGVMQVQSFQQDAYTQDDVDLLSGLANVAAIAIENARLYEAVQEELAERRRAENRLRFQAELLDAVGQAVIATDPDGEITYWNQYAEALYGWSKEEALGRDVVDITPAESSRSLANEIMDHLRAGETWTGEFTVRRRDGSTFPAEVTDSPLFDENGRLTGIIGISSDISERKRAQEQIQRLAARLKAIARSARQMSSLLDPDELTQQVVRSLQEITGCYNANFFLLEGNELVLAAGRGGYVNDRPPLGYRLSLGEGIIGHVAQTEEPVLVSDVTEDPHYVAWEGLPDTRSELAMPVKSGASLLGVIDMQSTVPDGFDTVDLEALGVLADQLAVALENARLYEKTEQRLKRLTALREIDMAITSSFDTRVTFNVILDQVTTQLGVDAAAFLLLDAHVQTLDYAAGRGFRTDAIQRTSLRLGEGYAGRAALKRRVVSIPDMTEIDNFVRAPLVAAEGFRAYYAAPLVAKGQIQGVLELFHREPLTVDPEWLNFLEGLALQSAIAVDNAELFDSLQRSNAELKLAYDSTLEGWAHALELRDDETQGHSRRVTQMTVRLARMMGMNDEKLADVRRGALLHDIGKMGIPDDILLKPGSLDDDEWEVMKQHPIHAYNMLSPIEFLQPALDIPYCHHEKWDGTGYPRGLESEQIPLPARIFAVVDVYDALTSNRPYRAAWSEEEARTYIREQAGAHFDPRVVEMFFEMLEDDDGR